MKRKHCVVGSTRLQSCHATYKNQQNKHTTEKKYKKKKVVKPAPGIITMRNRAYLLTLL